MVRLAVQLAQGVVEGGGVAVFYLVGRIKVAVGAEGVVAVEAAEDARLVDNKDDGLVDRTESHIDRYGIDDGEQDWNQDGKEPEGGLADAGEVLAADDKGDCVQN